MGKNNRVGVTVRFKRDEINVLLGVGQLIGAPDIKSAVKILTLEAAKLVLQQEKKRRDEALNKQQSESSQEQSEHSEEQSKTNAEHKESKHAEAQVHANTETVDEAAQDTANSGEQEPQEG
jgi:hypothetical protein